MQLSDLTIFTEPQQGAAYDDLLAVAQRAERLGFGAFFRSDHYLSMGDGDGMPGPTDAWITLGAIARETSTIRHRRHTCLTLRVGVLRPRPRGEGQRVPRQPGSGARRSSTMRRFKSNVPATRSPLPSGEPGHVWGPSATAISSVHAPHSDAT